MAHNVEKEIDGVIRTVTELDHTAQQIDDAVEITKLHSNPNLLDNWYFGNPVNQRGQTSYSTEWGYTIDRWQISTDSSLTVNNGSISLTGGYSFEPLEKISDALKGKTVTVSLLFATGELEFATGVVPTTWGEWDAIASNNHVGLHGIGEGSKRLWFLIRDNAKNILAAKLELGDHQTLARQDENGNWVLIDPPPNRQQELAKCQRYQTVYEGYSFLGFGNIDHDHRCQFAVPTPSTMRLGTVSVSAPNGIKLFDGKTSYNGTIFESHAACNAGSAKMVASFPDAPVSTGGYVWLDSGQKLILDANL